jgi:hypothetical protein
MLVLKQTFRFFILTTLILFAISGCKRLPNNGVPIYLQIDSPKVSVPLGSPLGSASSSIPDVWTTTGSQDLGAYEMPVNIPVILSASGLFAMTAGIYDNGIVNAPVKYPFYAPDTFAITNAIPGHLYHHKPVYSYYSYTQVAVNETFDYPDGKFSNVTILNNASDSNVYEGVGSGGIILSPNMDSIIALQTNGVSVITNGREAYMELNYKLPNVNTLLDVGIVGAVISGGQITKQTTFDKIILTNPIGIWNKVYLNFNNEIGTFSSDLPAGSTVAFQIYLTGHHQSPGSQDTIFVDNVKLLYFH